MWLPFAGKQNKVIAIVDIGSASVGAALVSIAGSETRIKPEVLFYEQEQTPVENEPSFDRFSAEISKALRAVLTRLLKAGKGSPDEYVVFLASSFVVSQTKVVSYQEDKPRPFTRKMLEGMTRQGADDFYVRNVQSTRDFCVIENRLMQITLDGYEIAEPYGNAARQIKIAQFLSGSPASIVNKLSDDIIAVGHRDNIQFHSYAFAAWSALRNNAISGKDFLAIDVSGELTDIIVSSDGILMENISFPYGLNKIVRDLAAAQGTVAAEVNSQLNLLAAGKLAPEAKQKMEQALRAVREKWMTGIKDSLTLALDNSMLPVNITLTGDTPLNQMFIDWLSTDELKKYTLGRGTFRTQPLDRELYAEVAGWTSRVPDTYILLESLFCEKLKIN